MKTTTTFLAALLSLTIACDGPWAKRFKQDRGADETRDDETEEEAPKRKKKPSTEPTAAAPASAAPTAETPLAVNYHANPRDVIPTLKKQTLCNPCRVMQLSLHPSTGTVKLQDASPPFHADFYVIQGRVLVHPMAIQFSGKQPTADTVRSNTFDIERDIDLTKVKTMIDAAPGHTKFDGGKVTHVIIHRELPFSTALVVLVYVNAPRRSGYVRYSAEGKVLKVHD